MSQVLMRSAIDKSIVTAKASKQEKIREVSSVVLKNSRMSGV